jgi:hypothetical protein
LAHTFSERMRSEVAGLVQTLELRAERQAASLELAAQPESLATNFDSLLRVREWRVNVHAFPLFALFKQQLPPDRTVHSPPSTLHPSGL